MEKSSLLIKCHKNLHLSPHNIQSKTTGPVSSIQYHRITIVPEIQKPRERDEGTYRTEV